MAYAPTTEQILDLDGVRLRIDGFRHELWDRDLTTVEGELHPKLDQIPTVENDADSDTSRRLRSFRLKPDEQADINVIRARIRTWMILQNGAEYLLGTFQWADAARPRRSWGLEQDAELVDRTTQLDQGALQSYSFARRTNITLIMFHLCFRAGLSQSDIAVIGPQADRGLTEVKAWEPGTTWLQMLKDLCDIVGFAKPWFDRWGKLHLETPPEPELGQPICRYAIDGSPGSRIVADSVVENDDILTAPTGFAVYESGTSATKIATYAIPTKAPHSAVNRGYYVTAVESAQGLENHTQAADAARKLGRTKGIAFEWIQFNSTADPRHDTFDVIEAIDRKWLETSWQIPCVSGGQMQHKARRVFYEF